MTIWAILRTIAIVLGTGIVGGAIAFLGNQLGRFIGRKKLSVFKLRPRYTSMLITVLTGMMIASLTLGLAMIVSEPVRITIINPEKFRKTRLEFEEMKKQMAAFKQTDLVYKKQDIILSAVIKSDPDVNKMTEALKEAVSLANTTAITKSQNIAREMGKEFKSPEAGRLVGYLPDNLKKVARELSRLNGEQVIIVRAIQHALLDQRFYVELGTPIPNELIFKKGELVYRTTIDGSKDYYDIYYQLLQSIKSDITIQALSRGLFPNPEDSSVGEFDDNQLKNFAREIKKTSKKVPVEFYSRDDTYTLGPLKLEFWIK